MIKGFPKIVEASECLAWCYNGIRVGPLIQATLKSTKRTQKSPATPPHICTHTHNKQTGAIIMIALSFSPFAVLAGRSILLSGRAVSTFHLRGSVMILLGRYRVALGVAAAAASAAVAAFPAASSSTQKCQATFFPVERLTAAASQCE